MADLIFIENNDNKQCKLACYSERGHLSYLFFRHLAERKNFEAFLELIEFPLPPGCTEYVVSDYVLFSELSLGQFGSPDGAFSFFMGGKKYFVFVEGKFNETYEASCITRNYGSSIVGQIELKHRMVLARSLWLKSDPKSASIVEDESIAKLYEEWEKLYVIKNRGESKLRKLHLKDGVRKFINELPMDINDIFYLIIPKQKGKLPELTMPSDVSPNIEGKCRLPFMSMGKDVDVDRKASNLLWLGADSVKNLIKRD